MGNHMKAALFWMAWGIASASTLGAQTPGDVDPLFQPVPTADSPYALRDASLTLAPDGALLGVRPDGVVRFRSDGSAERIAAGVDTMPDFFSWVAVRSDGRIYRTSGTSLLLQSSPGVDAWTTAPGVTPQAPLVDRSGGILLRGSPGFYRLGNNDTRDPWYGRDVAFVGANYATPIGSLAGSGSGITDGLLDSHDRLLVFGSLAKAGGLERLGIARMLPTGAVDPTWNPGRELGFTISASNDLNGLVVAVAAMADDSVLVLAMVSDEGGAFGYRLSRVDALGRVTNQFPNLKLQTEGTTVTQLAPMPDGGCVLVGSLATTGTTRKLVKVKPDGSEDASFRADFEGVAGGGPHAWRVAIQPDGYLAVAGRYRKVNGVERPGLARLYVQTPANEPPTPRMVSAPRRIAPGENLYLSVSGQHNPAASFQWMKGGVPVIGATNPGLSVAIAPGATVGDFAVVLSNSLGVVTQRFPNVQLSRRSPLPGTPTDATGVPVPSVGPPVVFAPDGNRGMWLGGRNQNREGEGAMLIRVTRSGQPDPGFGEDGVLKGLGEITCLASLPNGGVAVGGTFTRLAGVDCQGFLELDARGVPLRRKYPAFDVGRVSALLRLSDGGYLIAGQFQVIDGVSAVHLARLTPGLTVDPGFRSVFTAEQFIHSLGTHANGWLVAGGYDTGVSNPPPIGLVRVLGDGSLDPDFKSVAGPVAQFEVAPDGRIHVHGLSVGPNIVDRLDANGTLDSSFKGHSLRPPEFLAGPLGPSRQMAVLPSGETVIAPGAGAILSGAPAVRLDTTGNRDPLFEGPRVARFGSYFTGVAAFPDGTLLFSRYKPESAGVAPSQLWIQIVEADADLRLRPRAPVGGRFFADLETIRNRRYQIFRRESLDGPRALVQEIEGDGYLETIETSGDGAAAFLELRR